MTPEKGFPGLPEPVPLARFAAADDLRAAIGLWVGWLAGERRASAHTIAAYGRDLAFFLDFLTEHLGELCAAGEEHRPGVGVERRVPTSRGRLVSRSVAVPPPADAGDVESGVESAEALDRRRDGALGGRVLGQVAGEVGAAQALG